MSGPDLSAGYYGKLPSHGDFLRRGLPDDLVTGIDRWLQQAISNSRQTLGEAWLDLYLTMPVWHVSMGPDVCGSSPWTAVLIPSIDRVERQFPFLIAACWPSAAALVDAGDWHDKAEAVILSTLDEDFTLDALQEALADLTPPPQAAAFGRQPDDIDLAASMVALAAPSFSVWQSDGGADGAPMRLVARGMPPPDFFNTMIHADMAAAMP